MIEQENVIRTDLRIRSCWWLSLCDHYTIFEACMSSEYLGLHTYIHSEGGIQVSIEEARTGKGRKCRFCGKVNGSYVCDGMPKPSGMTIWGEEQEEKLDG